MGWLLLLFVLVPAVELALLIQIGRVVGTLPTLALIVFTGVLGAWLARRQGLAVVRQVRAEMADGRVPAGPVVDGILILVAGAVLMTPGLLTDLFGFFCLVPAGRRLLKGYLKQRLERAVRRGDVSVSVDLGQGGAPFGGRQERDVTPRERPAPGRHEAPRLGERGEPE
ncbi:MAG: FxsA family protein [Acidobacteriota bacterium]|nr:FxsA family protein [Acidobacteriota bacterium]